MTNCKTARIEFLPSKNKKIEVEFVDKDITSDGGILLLREVDKINNFTHRISSCIPEYRDPNRVIHSIDTMVKQRIYGLALGYEDVNDQDKLRKDKAMIIATDQSHELASSPTICRLENAVNRRAAVLIHKVMIDVFIKAHKKPPKQITLDADPTDLTIHGEQEGKHYHAYYGSNCFLPLNIFCGEHLLVNYLRPSNIDGSKHCWVILALLVKYIRKHWPNVNIIFRGDCAFSRDKILTWCEKNNVRYIVGQSSNEVLKRKSKGLLSRAANDYEKTGVKQKLFDQDFYAAKSWSKQRKVVMKTEYGIKGDNVRFVVTNLRGLPEDIYRQCYCPRGDMENRIKELKLDCYANRMSCSDWWPNQLRLLFSSCAYILLDMLRRTALKNTKLKNATCETIRQTLLKVGAIIKSNTRRITFLISQHLVNKKLFYTTAQNLQYG